MYLVKATILRTDLIAENLYQSGTLDPDMAFCLNVRNQVRPPLHTTQVKVGSMTGALIHTGRANLSITNNMF